MEQIRQAFEEWISQSPYERSLLRHSDDPTESAWPGQYVDYIVEVAWQSWQESCKAFQKPDIQICLKGVQIQ